MKILILSDDFPPSSFGGAGIIAFNQAKELLRLEHEIFVITTTKEKEKVGKQEIDGLVVFSVFSNVSERLRAYLTIYNPVVISEIEKIISEIQPDVVHAHNIHSQISYHAISIAKKYSKKVVITFHDVMPVHYGKLFPKININKNGEEVLDYKISWLKQLIDYKFRWNPFRNILIRYYLKKVDTKISVSHALADALSANGIKDIIVLHNGIDADDFSYVSSEVEGFRDKFNLNNKKVIFFGGRISGAKGGMVALGVLSELSSKFDDLLLLVAGKEDRYTEKLKEMAIKKGVGERLIITGWLDRGSIKNAYYASTFVLVPSLYLDPFPTVNLEALICKKPVLGTVYGGTKEVVIDEINGFIINPNNQQAVNDRAEELLSDQNLLNKFGNNGYDLVVNKFNAKRIASELIGIYECN